MAIKGVSVTLEGVGITVDPWIQTVSKRAGDYIVWSANENCKIKIEPDHPEHFADPLPNKCKKTIDGKFVTDVPLGTYKYRITVLEKNKDVNADVAVYSVDPDYKVDR